MSTESVGSCVGGGSWGAPPMLPIPIPLRNSPSPFREGQKLSPNTPDKKGTISHHCKQEGHWAWECPNKSMESPAPSPGKALFPKCPPNYPELLCKNCQQPCVVRISRTAANPDRDFYTCPGQGACDHFEWCDGLGDDGERKKNLNCNPTMTEEQNNTGMNNQGEILKNKDGITSEEMDLAAFSPPPPTTPRVDHNTTDYANLGSSPIMRPNLLKGSLSKHKCIEEQVSERIASPSLNERPSDTAPPVLNRFLNGEPKTLDPDKETVATLVLESPPPLERSQMERLSLAEGNPTKHEECLVCGGVGHEIDECDVLAQLVASPSLNEEPKTLGPNRETVGTPVLESPPPLQHPQMKRLSLAEGNSTKHEECLVCGGVGHGIDDCDVLAQLVAS